MNAMFFDCSGLKYLSFRGAWVDSLTDMAMFNYNTNNKIQMIRMPENMGGLKGDYDLPNWMYYRGKQYSFFNKDMAGGVLAVHNVDTTMTEGPRPYTDENGAEAGETWDCIWFGHYYQKTDAPYMDKDPIKWRILDIDEKGLAWLLSDKNLANVRYDNAPVSWKDSYSRTWLNYGGNDCFVDMPGKPRGFLREAFSFKE